jgi:hypothetical protein
MPYPPEELQTLDSRILKNIHTRAKLNKFKFEGDSLTDAKIDFGWGVEKIRKCILKLNGEPYRLNPEKNHFWRPVPLRGNRYPGELLYHFRAQNILEGFSVYTHIFFADDELGVSSFKHL